jgi:RNA polymerase sigma-70 factor (ECF subfamily)
MTEREFNNDITRIRPLLLHFAGSFSIGGAATAEDMVQEAVMRVWRSNEDGCFILNIEALTKQILKNVCIDYLRLKRNKGENLSNLKELITENDPYKQLEIKREFARMKEAIKSLPLDQQMCIRLKDVMGYETKEIAEIIETTEINVRTLLCRGRKTIKERVMK